MRETRKEEYADDARHVRVSLGDPITLTSHQHMSKTIVEVVPVKGKYPNVDRVLPNTPPAAIARVDARLLIKLLEIAAAVDTEYAATEIEIHPATEGQSPMILVRSKNRLEDGWQEYLGVLVQLSKIE